MTPHTKICTRCSTEKPLADYHRRNHRVRLGVRARDAIRRGALVPLPCRDCGNPTVEPHHPDYTTPDTHLRVTWYCRQHHALEHGTHSWTKQLDLFPMPRAAEPPIVTSPKPPLCLSPAWAGQLELFAAMLRPLTALGPRSGFQTSSSK